MCASHIVDRASFLGRRKLKLSARRSYKNDFYCHANLLASNLTPKMSSFLHFRIFLDIYQANSELGTVGKKCSIITCGKSDLSNTPIFVGYTTR